jgi:hypothetical protein
MNDGVVGYDPKESLDAPSSERDTPLKVETDADAEATNICLSSSIHSGEGFRI